MDKLHLFFFFVVVLKEFFVFFFVGAFILQVSDILKHIASIEVINNITPHLVNGLWNQ